MTPMTPVPDRPVLAPRNGVACLLVGLVVAVSVAAVSWLAMGSGAFVEGSPIEVLSALGYLVGGAVVLFGALRCADRGPRVNAILGAGILFLLAAREMDLHKIEALGSITRSATYLDPTRPIGLRLLAALILVAAIALVIAFALRTLAPVARRPRNLIRAIPIALIGSAVLLGIAKAFDGLGRKLLGVGIEVGPAVKFLFVCVEETLELAAPVALCAIAVLFAIDAGQARNEVRSEVLSGR